MKGFSGPINIFRDPFGMTSSQFFGVLNGLSNTLSDLLLLDTIANGTFAAGDFTRPTSERVIGALKAAGAAALDLGGGEVILKPFIKLGGRAFVALADSGIFASESAITTLGITSKSIAGGSEAIVRDTVSSVTAETGALATESSSNRLLNIGSGNNPLPGAVNFDIRADIQAVKNVDIVRADANNLPFFDNTFPEAVSINPAGDSKGFFNPLAGDVGRVLQPGSNLSVVAQRSNYAFRQLLKFDDATINAFGFERITKNAIPAEQRFIFGQSATISGQSLFMGKAQQLIFRKLP
jgi:hypothetical protein